MQGIKFNRDGITAILECRKTMTRRPLTDEQKFQCFYHCPVSDFSKYKIGETVFVQEEFINNEEVNEIIYRADYESGWSGFCAHWNSSSEMTEKEARIFLKITNIKVERLQDISEEDCIKEGVQYVKTFYRTNKKLYDFCDDCFEEDIWNKLPYQAPYDWNSNPYVFVYEFEVVK